jgi:hypothetical protein
MASIPEPWFLAAIQRGLSRLLTLSLDRTPAAELLGETANTWADALWPNRNWFVDVDVERIAEAFRRISGAHRQWPAPADLIANLPSRHTGAALALPARGETDADRERCMRSLSEILAKLDMRDQPPTTETVVPQ